MITAERQQSLADGIALTKLQRWWRDIAQIRKEEFPILYEMSAAAREWAKKNGYPHAP